MVKSFEYCFDDMKTGGSMYQFKIKNANRFLVFFIITIFIIALPLGADARGIFTLKPILTASWETDDNLYKAETVKREIYTYLIQPGFELGYETGKTFLNIDYTLNSYDYRDQDSVPAGSQPADSENYTGHTAVFDLKIQPTRRLQIGLENSYYKTRDPASSDEFNNSITRDEYYINRLI